jgi:hypothetical protein
VTTAGRHGSLSHGYTMWQRRDHTQRSGAMISGNLSRPQNAGIVMLPARTILLLDAGTLRSDAGAAGLPYKSDIEYIAKDELKV